MQTTAKKRFGQHFLRDTGVLERICRLIHALPDEVIIEIGAGDGALSTRLAPRAHRLLAIEVDPDCLPSLERALSPFPSACIIPGDIMAMDIDTLAGEDLSAGRRLRAVGNLPYNIATAIIQRLLGSQLPFADMVFMVQLEVAERITARPGTRQYGLLSILCQHRAGVHIAFKVSPSCFVPRPKVVSAIIRLLPSPGLRKPEVESCFVETAKAAFAHRRKTLANSLRRHPGFWTKTAELLERAGIDGSRRPEDLTVQEYERLALTRLQRMANHE
ncbi:MAG TPA: 16S rRNA (adenine(1518)-N(6)/adenine(1519)-N(6))-dimethyltransferase RsmA [Acidobacteriota bacterium]|nr:16S rRNA (adenine(1518)-N(6)/adenine(1519)-N(6))-dimethyltransferase RsmA [Acidobacteriota bacterium]